LKIKRAIDGLFFLIGLIATFYLLYIFWIDWTQRNQIRIDIIVLLIASTLISTVFMKKIRGSKKSEN